MSQMERTWPDKEKNMKLHFFSFSPLFSFYPLCRNMRMWIVDWISQSTLSEKTANRTYPRSEFWKFHPKFCFQMKCRKFSYNFQKIRAKIAFLAQNFLKCQFRKKFTQNNYFLSVYRNVCQTSIFETMNFSFLKFKNTSSSISSEKMLFSNCEKSNFWLFGTSQTFLFGVKSENTIWLIMPIS